MTIVYENSHYADKISAFCKKHGIRKLSFFGSVLRDDFRPDSDLDVLVEFTPGIRVGFLSLAGMELELENIVGRKVDMNTAGCISPYFRNQVLSEARTQYEQA